MAYRIRIGETARRELGRLPGHLRQRARRLVESLAGSPRPTGATELRGQPGLYRIRLLRWRVIYRIDDESRLVLVLTVREKEGPETYDDLGVLG